MREKKNRYIHTYDAFPPAPDAVRLNQGPRRRTRRVGKKRVPACVRWDGHVWRRCVFWWRGFGSAGCDYKIHLDTYHLPFRVCGDLHTFVGLVYFVERLGGLKRWVCESGGSGH